MKRPVLITFGIVALAAVLIYGLVQVFTLRFQHGDVYPPYSTLRGDPLGAKVLHDAIDGMPGFRVQRNFRPITEHRAGEQITLVYSGIERRSIWGESEIKTLEALVTNGARAAFAFAPEDLASARAAFKPVPIGVPKSGKKPAATPAPPAPPAATPGPTAPTAETDEPNDDVFVDDGEGVKFSEIRDRWGAAFALPKGKTGAAFDRRAIATTEADGLEPDLSWHSALYFKDLSPAWRTLYTCEGKPVVIERKYGDGTIVLAADAYFLSNEALRKERSPRLLGWFIGPPRTLIFDEESHGVTENANLASLTRKYRLQGVVAGLGLIAALFVWKHAFPLVPKRRDLRVEDSEVRGKDAEEGFINLLRRSISVGQIVKVCAEEWERAHGHRARAEETAHVRAVLRAHEAKTVRDPVAAYRTIAQGLARKNPKP
jgi:hypothetical protein